MPGVIRVVELGSAEEVEGAPRPGDGSALAVRLGVGATLAGRLLMFDALSTEFSEVKIWRDPACPACGEGSLS